MNYEISLDTLKNAEIMEEVFENILNICNQNKMLVVWAKEAQLFSNYEHYKILYPLVSAINDDRRAYNVTVFDDDSKYINFISDHSKGDINVFISNLINNSDDNKIIIKPGTLNCENGLIDTLEFDLHIKPDTVHITSKFQKIFDKYINSL